MNLLPILSPELQSEEKSDHSLALSSDTPNNTKHLAGGRGESNLWQVNSSVANGFLPYFLANFPGEKAMPRPSKK